NDSGIGDRCVDGMIVRGVVRIPYKILVRIRRRSTDGARLSHARPSWWLEPALMSTPAPAGRFSRSCLLRSPACSKPENRCQGFLSRARDARHAGMATGYGYRCGDGDRWRYKKITVRSLRARQRPNSESLRRDLAADDPALPSERDQSRSC